MAKKNKGFINAVYIAQENKLRRASLISRMQTLDKVIITLGQIGMTPEEIANFNLEFYKVEEDFCTEVLADAENDKSMEYAKACIDRALKQYVLPENFIPYEERYNF